VPEGRQVFPDLTVYDNLVLGAHSQPHADVERQIAQLLERFPRLRDRLYSRAGLLSGGEQQMLAIARGLMAQPRVLLLDEPSLGLAPRLVDVVFEALEAIRERGVCVLLVEQRAQRTVALADRSYLLANGELRLVLTPDDAHDTERMVAAYLS